MKSLVLVLLFLIGCTVTHKTPVDVPSEDVEVTIGDFKGKWNRADWDAYLVNAIKIQGKALLEVKPKDWKDYIDVWPSTENGVLNFWANIFVTMSKFESNWNPSTKYRESFGVTSRGLYQISVPSVNQTRYGCGVKNEMDLHKPEINIPCAVRIFSYWVRSDGVIRGKVGSSWRGPARYWSVVRGVSSTHTKKALEAIKNANK